MLKDIISKSVFDSPSLKIQLKKGVSIVQQNQTILIVENNGIKTKIEGLTPSICDALISLSFAPQSKNNLGVAVVETDGYAALSRLLYEVKVFEELGLLVFNLYQNETLLCSFENMMFGAISNREVSDLDKIKISQFAFIRSENDSLVLESSKDSIKVKVNSKLFLNIIHSISSYKSILELQDLSNLNDESTRDVLNLLAAGNFLTFESTGSAAKENLWNFHDSLFHNRSRYGKHNYSSGGSYRYLGKTKPKLARRDIKESLKDIYLKVPNESELQKSKSLHTCIETRTSTRDFNGLDISTLGTFLYRCLRVKGVYPIEIQNKAGEKEIVETLRTPYPSGGGLYELGFYLTVSDCKGLQPGFYYYNVFEHKLSLITLPNINTDNMVWYAKMSTSMTESPPVVITFAADFERMFWKYESMAYAAILKNVGVIYQTMYLVATDLGIGACGMGNGNTEVFKKLIGKSKMEESSVGEFIIGNSKNK